MNLLDILAFTASLVASLAWPLPVLIVVLIFKESLKTLSSAIEHVKFAGVDLKLSKAVEKVRIEAEEALPEPPTAPRDLSNLHPAAAILESWMDLEIELRAVGKRLGISTDPRIWTITIAEKLRERNIWNEETYNIFTGVRDLRNSVVHTVPVRSLQLKPLNTT